MRLRLNNLKDLTRTSTNIYGLVKLLGGIHHIFIVIVFILLLMSVYCFNNEINKWALKVYMMSMKSMNTKFKLNGGFFLSHTHRLYVRLPYTRQHIY